MVFAENQLVMKINKHRQSFIFIITTFRQINELA